MRLGRGQIGGLGRGSRAGDPGPDDTGSGMSEWEWGLAVGLAGRELGAGGEALSQSWGSAGTGWGGRGSRAGDRWLWITVSAFRQSV